MLWALFQLSSRVRGREDNGWMRVRLPEVATRVGLSPETVERRLLALATAGVIRRTRLPTALAAERMIGWLFIAMTERCA